MSTGNVQAGLGGAILAVLVAACLRDELPAEPSGIRISNVSGVAVRLVPRNLAEPCLEVDHIEGEPPPLSARLLAPPSGAGVVVAPRAEAWLSPASKGSCASRALGGPETSSNVGGTSFVELADGAVVALRGEAFRIEPGGALVPNAPDAVATPLDPPLAACPPASAPPRTKPLADGTYRVESVAPDDACVAVTLRPYQRSPLRAGDAGAPLPVGASFAARVCVPAEAWPFDPGTYLAVERRAEGATGLVDVLRAVPPTAAPRDVLALHHDAASGAYRGRALAVDLPSLARSNLLADPLELEVAPLACADVDACGRLSTSPARLRYLGPVERGTPFVGRTGTLRWILRAEVRLVRPPLCADGDPGGFGPTTIPRAITPYDARVVVEHAELLRGAE